MASLGRSFIYKGLDAGVRLLAYVAVFMLASNLLSRAGYGEAQQALALAAVFAAVADLGLGTSTRWYIGNLEVERPELTRAFIARTLGLAAGFGTTASVALLLLRRPLAAWFDAPELPALVWIAAPLVLMTLLNNLVVAILGSLERFGLQALVGALYTGGLATAVAIMLGWRPEPASLVTAHLASTAPAVILGALLIHGATRGRPAPVAGARPPSPLGIAWGVFVVTVGHMALLRGTVLLVGLYRDAGEVALFAVADRFFNVPALGMHLFTAVIAARMARLWTAGDREAMQRVYQVSLGVATLSFGAGIAALMVATPTLLQLVSPKYPDAAPLIWILLAVSLPRVLGQVAWVGVLLATGRPGPLVVATLAELVAIGAGAALVVPRHGALGMAAVAAAVHLGFAVTCVLLVRRHLGLRFRVTLGGARSVLFPPPA